MLKIIFAISLMLSGCIDTPQEYVGQPPSVPVIAIPRIRLQWENTDSSVYPEREWSDFLIQKILNNIDELSKASDIKDFCPSYSDLKIEDKYKAWGELFASVAFYESNFKADAKAVDVGTKDNKDTWSVGLFQMSVVDFKNYDMKKYSPTLKEYNFQELNTGLPNISLAFEIMLRQIKTTKRIVVLSKPYWSVIYDGPYSKIKQIKLRMIKYAPKCAGGK
jgi:hypothetical protein